MELTHEKRIQIWETLIPELENFYDNTNDLDVSPELDKDKIAGFVRKFHSGGIISPEVAISHVIEGLKNFSVHTPHPGYFGLFNPRPVFAGILADTITASFNPQMAAWSHSPFAAETEKYLIREFGKKFGYAESETDGNFTTGGQEANLTAVLCALNFHYPDYHTQGIQSLSNKPVIYCSQDVHHSIVRAATITGLGINAIRSIETDQKHRMSSEKLELQIKIDIQNGFHPFLIVASMGTTGTGAIDPIEELYRISKAHNCWLHADAAYGGAVVLNDSWKHLIEGISQADSITFDAHKWLSVPMSAGIFITRHPTILDQTFRIKADYMPKDAGSMDIQDPFSHSIQWSRRFIGLKVYLSLLIYGWKGWSELVDDQIQKGQFLKQKLLESNWIIYNDTPLPVICFGKESFKKDENLAGIISQKVILTRKAWVSVYKVKEHYTLRACVTNYKTSEKDINELVDILNKAGENI